MLYSVPHKVIEYFTSRWRKGYMCIKSSYIQATPAIKSYRNDSMLWFMLFPRVTDAIFPVTTAQRGLRPTLELEITSVLIS